ncbi:MAG: hypothetical protein CV089_11430 [Nitrospira sp. WS110]|nr:hypothetical protein [Nitrospira sp. WS110]
MIDSGVSPASSGPAGSLFEGQVGAFYLLSLLTDTEPRGLPGTVITRVEFQRAAEGHPLDDVIVHAHSPHGEAVLLEIQVKRSIIFAPADKIFRDVVGQISEASQRPAFWTTRYELAIATARTSQKINGAYQDVLTWAREIGDAATFMGRINRPGSANDSMRQFVKTFKFHLHETGSSDDDETVWRLLRRLQILVFDFTAPGSVSEQLAKERAVRALHKDDTMRAGALWTTLVELAMEAASSGGDRTRDRLIEDLRVQSFRLAGERRYASARAKLAEYSRHALEDINDRIGNVILTRHARTAAIHTTLGSGRYVEIRGDAGVGKSGLLKHFAEKHCRESPTIVLKPNRTVPRGWSAMRATLGFDGSAHDLMTDLAADGGAVLFIDNLDFFDEEERSTVVDLVREAAGIPGFSVIATARRQFGIDEPNWLPSEALDRLGRTEPIMLGELSEDEVDEVRHAAPKLVPLLAENHPARAVTRNLFRLARLASQPRDTRDLRTEVDMAEQWWQTADGKKHSDGHWRDRTRLLRALAEAALSHIDVLDVSQHPAQAIDALVKSETLSDLGSDRVVFRHDVLREWAIGNLIYVEPTMIECLPLERPASATLARGVELAARMALERTSDGLRWQSLLERVSDKQMHGSWRRAVVLALVRSEISWQLLARVSNLLFANRASILRELIRIVMAVDVEPASKVFQALGVDATLIPQSFNIPSGPSWHRLIAWLLSLKESLPVAAIPDVVDLYTKWSSGMLGHDLLTPRLVPSLYQWLIEIETARDARSFFELRDPFSGDLDRDQIASLEPDLRAGFLLFCHRRPELAAEYLRSLSKRHHRPDDVIRNILKFRGNLAQVAPVELAELTAMALIPQSDEAADDDDIRTRGPFTHHDLDFVPPSPGQGPFYELLSHAPQQGLTLIRRLVDHAISFYTDGREHGADAFILSFPDGERNFPWTRSYGWSRDSARHNSLTSALMALEAWAHRRIEAGESVELVLADVLGPPGSPAAFLLVAVDLVLSHWPKSREAAVPFVASPELLCVDRQRQLQESIGQADLFGLSVLNREPAGTVSLDSLKTRLSRCVSLEVLLGHYALGDHDPLCETLKALVHRTAERLGPPDQKSNFTDPAFMATHAMNRLDPNNWQERSVQRTDGTQAVGHQYVSPETERQHLESASLETGQQDRWENFNMQLSVLNAMEEPSKSSPQLATAAVEWAQRVMANLETGEPDEEGDPGEDFLRENALVSAALIALRDGDDELRARHLAWALSVFAEALRAKDDPVIRFRPGLRYNPIAIAFVGMSYALKYKNGTGEIRTLLEVATREEPAAAHGFGVAGTILAAVDERLLRAVLRCAFVGSIRPHRRWGSPKEDVAARFEQHRQRAHAAIDAELAWLANERPELAWPEFPTETPRLRRPLRLTGSRRLEPDEPVRSHTRPDEYADHQAAAAWLTNCHDLVDIARRPWFREIVRSYASWTAQANGARLGEFEDVDNPPHEWNDAYFTLLARCLPGLPMSEIEQLALIPLCSFPDRSFFDVLPQFLRSSDVVYFNDQALEASIAVSIRSKIAERLMASRGWERLRGHRGSSIETHIGPAIAVLFFSDYGYTQPIKCYLPPACIDRLAPFFPVLEKLIESGPSLFVALVTLNLLEVSPQSTHLSFLVAAATVWLSSYPDVSEFWVAHGIGRRVCTLIEQIQKLEPAMLDKIGTIRSDLDRALAVLVNLGVAEARRLEELLSKGAG